MKRSPIIWLAHEGQPCAALVDALSELGAAPARAFPIAGLPTELPGCDLVILEQCRSDAPATPRIYSLVEANPETEVVVLVREPRARLEPELYRAGAFAVLDAGADLVRELPRVLAAAGRLLIVRQRHRDLLAEVAHQDRIAALGVLAAGVSHEVNNPCAAILSNVANLRDDLEALMRQPRFARLAGLEPFAVSAIEALGDCIAAGHRIADIVNTLTMFSRRNDRDPEVDLDIKEEIESVLRLLGCEVTDQVNFGVELQPALPSIKGRRNSVAQVVTNLVMNALDATRVVPDGDRRISLRTAFDEDYIVIEVSDNGVGIDPATANRIFDPFFTTKPPGEGTGLGLAVSHKLIQQMGGEILVDSLPGEGAKFSVFLPRRSLCVVDDESR